MFYLNGVKVEFSSFPDGTAKLSTESLHIYENNINRIVWLYDGDQECIQLWYLNELIRARSNCRVVHLSMPYIPNARMDRTDGDDLFTLKYFAKFINSMGFAKVDVVDPHSNVSNALFDRVSAAFVDYKGMIDFYELNPDGDLVLCFPDEGAAKRYRQFTGDYPCVFGTKTRDWKTGRITDLVLSDTYAVAGRPVLIIDDICSRGGTFIRMAELLREAEASDVKLFVTHCENTILDGEIPDSDLISHVYTTDSLFRKEHEKITATEVFSLDSL